MRLIGVGDLKNGVYCLRNGMEGTSFMVVWKQGGALWHQRLGHPSYGSLSTLSSLYGFELNKGLCDCCDICHRAKQTHNAFCFTDSKALQSFSLIQCDLWGCYRTLSFSGHHYFLCVVDDYNCVAWVFLLRDKTETYEKLVNFCFYNENLVWLYCPTC